MEAINNKAEKTFTHNLPLKIFTADFLCLFFFWQTCFHCKLSHNFTPRLIAATFFKQFGLKRFNAL